jgi:hypothetical protein
MRIRAFDPQPIGPDTNRCRTVCLPHSVFAAQCVRRTVCILHSVPSSLPGILRRA